MARKNTYKIKAGCPIGYGEMSVLLTYTVTWGSPAQGPSYASGGQPAEPGEVDLLSAHLVDPWAISPEMQELIERWAEEWLTGEGLDDALENAFSSNEAAREFAADLRADR